MWTIKVVRGWKWWKQAADIDRDGNWMPSTEDWLWVIGYKHIPTIFIHLSSCVLSMPVAEFFSIIQDLELLLCIEGSISGL